LTQIPKDLARIDSIQNTVSENEKNFQNVKKLVEASNLEVEKLNSRDKCYKTFFDRNLLIFVRSWSICYTRLVCWVSLC
jgi:hypothetical protein